MDIYRQFVVFALPALLFSCTYYIDHNPDLAVKIANEFSQTAFVERDFPRAYETLPPEKLDTFTESAFEQMVISMHPGGNFPTSVHPTGWEIVPGKSIINVYLSGQILDHPTYYRLELSGDSKRSYTISGMYRRDSPFETSDLYRTIK